MAKRNVHPYDKPSERYNQLAKEIAALERERLDLWWAEVLKREPVDTLNYNYTLICNTCGDTNVAIYELFHDGEYTGWDMRCRNDECKASKRR